MKKILFVTYGGGHANIVRTLYPALKDNYCVEIIALMLSDIILDRYGIPYKKIKNYLHLFEEKRRILGYGNTLAEKAYDINSGLEYDDLVAYLGLSFWDLCKEYNDEGRAKDVYEMYGRSIFNPLSAMEKIISFEMPDLVIVTCEVRMEKAAGQVANKLGIPVIHILDALWRHDGPLPYRAVLCVMNETAKNNIMPANKEMIEKIYVTGQPVLEDDICLKGRDVERIRCFRRKYSHYAKVITYFSANCFENMEAQIGEELLCIAGKHPEDLFIIKLHPNDSASKISQMKSMNNFIVVKNEEETKTLLNVCEVAITTLSTVGLEAAAMNKSLLVINWDKLDYGQADFSKYNIAIESVKRSELERDIYCCLTDMEKRRKLQCEQKNFYPVKGAVNQIVNIINKELA